MGRVISQPLGTVTGLVSGDIVYLDLKAFSASAKTVSIQCQGTWDGADVTFQISNDNTNFYNAYDGATLLQLDDDGWLLVASEASIGSFGFCRCVVANGSGSEDITLTATAGME